MDLTLDKIKIGSLPIALRHVWRDIGEAHPGEGDAWEGVSHAWR